MPWLVAGIRSDILCPNWTRGIPDCGNSFLATDGKEHMKRRPHALFRLRIYVAVVIDGYLFAHSQSDTRALVIRFAMEALKDIEDLPGVALAEADAVIPK